MGITTEFLGRATRVFVAAAILASAGIGALTIASGGTASALAALVATVMIFAALLSRSEARQPFDWRRWARRMAGALVLVLAAMGAATLSPGLGLLQVAGLVAVWYALDRRSGKGLRGVLGLVPEGERVWRRLQAQTRLGIGAGAIRGQLRRLDNRLLVDVWRACRRQAFDPLPPRAALDVATLREFVLDEFEERDPEAFHAWLDAGASAPAPLGRAARS